MVVLCRIPVRISCKKGVSYGILDLKEIDMVLTLDKPIVEVYESNGTINAKRLAVLIGLSQTELAKAIGRDRTAISRGTTSAAQKGLVAILALFLRILRLVGGREDLARIWLHAPNPELDHKQPVDFLTQRKLHVLESIVSAVEEGVPD
jgi:hypothetical protein